LSISTILFNNLGSGNYETPCSLSCFQHTGLSTTFDDDDNNNNINNSVQKHTDSAHHQDLWSRLKAWFLPRCQNQIQGLFKDFQGPYKGYSRRTTL